MHRIEARLKSHLTDARGQGLVKDIADLGITMVTEARVIDVYWLDADLASDEVDLICRRLFADPVTQDYFSEQGPQFKGEISPLYHVVEVAYNAGVADPIEESILKAIRDLGISGVRAVKTAKKYLIKGQLKKRQLDIISSRLLVNPIIQHVVAHEQVGFPEKPQYHFALNHIDILDMCL